jgi:DNA polymerase III alpha subunit
MITISASDSFGNIDAVAFGDLSIELANILSKESLVLISGKTSNRDDRVSVFVDSITPLSQWVAKIAKKITLDVWNGAVLPDLKKTLSTLPSGSTRVVLNLHGADKVATMALPGGVELGENTAADLSALGIKVQIE